MQYKGMAALMFPIYKASFKKSLIQDLKYSKVTADKITKKAKISYREIIAKLPEFEKEDIYSTNIINCAMLISFFMNMEKRPTVEEATVFYENSMTMWATKFACKMDAKDKFTAKDINSMKKTAALKAADRNPYSWNMDFLPYEDGSGYEARFTACGICKLMKEYGFFDLTPAMCHLDYTMNDMGGKSKFVRKYTLASGGPYCDCGYLKK